MFNITKYMTNILKNPIQIISKFPSKNYSVEFVFKNINGLNYKTAYEKSKIMLSNFFDEARDQKENGGNVNKRLEKFLLTYFDSEFVYIIFLPVYFLFVFIVINIDSIDILNKFFLIFFILINFIATIDFIKMFKLEYSKDKNIKESFLRLKKYYSDLNKEDETFSLENDIFSISALLSIVCLLYLFYSHLSKQENFATNIAFLLFKIFSVISFIFKTNLIQKLKKRQSLEFKYNN